MDADRRAAGGHVGVGGGGRVPLAVELDSQEAEGVAAPLADRRGVLADPPGEDERVETFERRGHRGDRAAETVEVDLDGKARVLVPDGLRLEDRPQVGGAGET